MTRACGERALLDDPGHRLGLPLARLLLVFAAVVLFFLVVLAHVLTLPLIDNWRWSCCDGAESAVSAADPTRDNNWCKPTPQIIRIFYWTLR